MNSKYNINKYYTVAGMNLPRQLPESQESAGLRIVDVCDEHISSPGRILELIRELPASHQNGTKPVPVVQWELPPLHGEQFIKAEEKLDAIAGELAVRGVRFMIVANDMGILKAAGERKIPVIMGRSFAKSHQRLPEDEKPGQGRWITLDAVTLFLPDGPPLLPYLNTPALEVLREAGVMGIDLDGSLSALNDTMQEIPEEFELYFHSDDIFMAVGRTCLYSMVNGKCRSRECVQPSFTFRYQKDAHASGEIDYYDTPFYFSGKTVLSRNGAPNGYAEEPNPRVYFLSEGQA